MLESGNVVLRALLLEDLPVLYQWINNRELVHYSAPYKPITEEQHRNWFQSIQNSKDHYIFAIENKLEEKIIGSCQLVNVHNIHRNSEIVIRIGDEENCGKGYGLEAVKLLLEFAFNDLNLVRVFVHVFSTNKRAIAMYKKAGFNVEGTLRKAAYINGNYVDVIVMSILKEEHNR